MRQLLAIIIFFLCLAIVSNAQSWLLTGNTGLTNSNFLGSIDERPVIFKTNGFERGRIQANGTWRFGLFANNATIDSAGVLRFNGTGGYQVADGRYVFQSSTHPNYGLWFGESPRKFAVDFAPGYEFFDSNGVSSFEIGADRGTVFMRGDIHFAGTLYNFDSRILFIDNAHSSSFLGQDAGLQNTGVNNSFFGSEAGIANSNGAGNSFFGARSGYRNTLGQSNSFFGSGSGISNTVGNYNSATGSSALAFNTSGGLNTATGFSALSSNLTGSENSAAGAYALYSNTSGASNTAIGYRALYSNTVGSYNVAAGFEAGPNSTGSGNTFIGDSSGFSNTIGFANTFVGSRAGQTNTSGDGNTFMGVAAGDGITTGKNNSFFGANVGAATGSIVNSIAIGQNFDIDQSNAIRLGSSIKKIGIGKNPLASDILDFSVTTAKLTTGGVWTDASSEKLKENFKTLNRKDILDKITQLKITEWNYKAENPNIKHVGPMAEEFYRLFQLGDDSTIASMDKAGVALLGIQQLANQNNELQKQNEQLRSEIGELRLMLLQLQQNFNSCNACAQQTTSNIELQTSNDDRCSLQQNIPNPFDHTTTINYTLPQQYSSAKIIVVDKVGRVLKEINILGSGKGSFKIDAGTFPAGAYNYSLFLDGQLIATKQMVITR